MRLVSAEIEGYRSIKETITFQFDSNVSVVLGANDQGKSNLLSAFLHLNAEHSFDGEYDLNWDRTDSAETLPRVCFELALGADEQAELRSESAERHRKEIVRSHFEAADTEIRSLTDNGAVSGPRSVPSESNAAAEGAAEDKSEPRGRILNPLSSAWLRPSRFRMALMTLPPEAYPV